MTEPEKPYWLTHAEGRPFPYADKKYLKERKLKQSVPMTSDDAQQIIRLLKRINEGIRHLEAEFGNCVWELDE